MGCVGPEPGQGHRKCAVCARDFFESFLWSSFQVSVCNPCKAKDKDGADCYGLVTKTTAKEVHVGP